jgi:hypothetical protein
MAGRRGRKSHGHRRRSVRRSRRGTSGGIGGKIGKWFKGVTRRPVTKIIAPTLAGIGIAQVVLTQDGGGYSAVDHIMAAVEQQTTNQLHYVPGALQAGLQAALPNLGMAAVAAVIGHYTHT